MRVQAMRNRLKANPHTEAMNAAMLGPAWTAIHVDVLSPIARTRRRPAPHGARNPSRIRDGHVLFLRGLPVSGDAM